MTLEGLDWDSHLQWTYLYSMKYFEKFRVEKCDASMDILIYGNEYFTLIFIMLKQRSKIESTMTTEDSKSFVQ